MRGSRFRSSLLAWAVLLLAHAALAQAGFPNPGSDPMGKVLDELGRPVAGAEVELRVDLASEGTWADAVAQILAATPLPNAVSDADGDFVLPLTRLQRTLGAGGEGSFWLVVSKPGHRTWSEHLPRGLRGFLGSRVVLPRKSEPDPLAELPWPAVIPLHKGQSDLQIAAAAECRMPQNAIRRPPPPAPRDGIGAAKLVIRVRDGDDKPIPGAILRCSDGLFATNAAIGARVWMTNESGDVTIERLAAGSGQIFAVADGFALKATACNLVGRDVQELRLVGKRTRSFCVATVDADGAPMPFASIMLMAATEDAGGRTTTLLQSDSQGRIVVEIVAGQQATLYSAPTLNTQMLAPDSPDHLDFVGTATETWLALVPESNQWSLKVRTARSSSSRSNRRIGETGISTFLVRAPTTGTTTFECGGPKGPSTTIDGSGGQNFTIAGQAVRLFDRRSAAQTRPASKAGR